MLDERAADAFAAALMLSIAYAASIGGMGTLIGSPPNTLLAGFMQERFGVEITFLGWMTLAMPMVVVFPTPFRPITQRHSPFSRFRSTSQRVWDSP